MIPNTFKELDFDLGNDVNILKDSIQEFCKREIAPLAEDIDKKNDFPSHLWKKMGELGLLGITAEENMVAVIPYYSRRKIWWQWFRLH